MKKAHFSERGQALIIFVFALIGLIGITGLAVDGGSILAERRHVQNAADTAAMAGALAKINGQEANSTWTNALCSTTSSACWSKIVTTAKNRASSNGYTGDLVNNTVEVHIPPISGPYSVASYSLDPRDYVQVIITTNVNTFFAKVLGIAQTHNRVEAVALAKYAPEAGLYDGNSLVELAPHSTACNGDFKTTGDVKLTLDGGGVWVNSDNTTCAFVEEAGCVDWTLNPPPPDPNSPVVSVFGGSKYSSCPETPPIVAAPHQVPFPPEPLFPEPAECNQSWPQPLPDGNGNYIYQPGHYSGNQFPPDRNSILSAGVYCIDNLVKLTGNNASMVGNGVMLYIRPGGYFDFQGGTVSLSAPTSGTYKGYLIYVASNFNSWGDENCGINGDVVQDLTGTIYAPNCNVTFNGGATAEQYAAQVIAYTLKLNGTAGLTFHYDPDKVPRIPEIRYTGLYR